MVSNQVTMLEELDDKHSTLHQVVTDSCLSRADSSNDLSSKVNNLSTDLHALESRVLRLLPFLHQSGRAPLALHWGAVNLPLCYPQFRLIFQRSSHE
jgi:hypothetical protein